MTPKYQKNTYIHSPQHRKYSLPRLNLRQEICQTASLWNPTWNPFNITALHAEKRRRQGIKQRTILFDGCYLEMKRFSSQTDDSSRVGYTPQRRVTAIVVLKVAIPQNNVRIFAPYESTIVVLKCYINQIEVTKRKSGLSRNFWAGWFRNTQFSISRSLFEVYINTTPPS